jgi:hypothetical protein
VYIHRSVCMKDCGGCRHHMVNDCFISVHFGGSVAVHVTKEGPGPNAQLCFLAYAWLEWFRQLNSLTLWRHTGQSVYTARQGAGGVDAPCRSSVAQADLGDVFNPLRHQPLLNLLAVLAVHTQVVLHLHHLHGEIRGQGIHTTDISTSLWSEDRTHKARGPPFLGPTSWLPSLCRTSTLRHAELAAAPSPPLMRQELRIISSK